MTRRHQKEDSAAKMITDIYDKMKTADSTATLLPTFVAADFSRIPRARENTDSLATREQVLASIHSLRCRIDLLDSKSVTHNFLTAFFDKRMGSSTASPPLPPLAPLSAPLEPSALPQSQSVSLSTSTTELSAPSQSQTSASSTSSSTSSFSSLVASLPPQSVAPSSHPSAAAPIPEATASDGKSWSDKQQRRRKNTDNTQKQKRGGNIPIVIGKSVNSGVVSWKGADLTVARYVGRVALGTTVEDISSFLQGKGVEIVELLPLALKHDRFLSFKLVVKRAQLSLIENEELWPEGVIVGRYWPAKSASAANNLDNSNGD